MAQLLADEAGFCSALVARETRQGDGGDKKSPARGAGLSYAGAWWGLAGGDVGRAGAFLALSDLEAHRLALTE